MPSRYNRTELDPRFREDPFDDMQRRLTDMDQLHEGDIIEMVMPMLQPSDGLPIAFINQTLRVHALNRALPPMRACEHMPELEANIIPGSVPPMIEREGITVFEERTHGQHESYAADDPFRYRDLDATGLTVEPLVIPGEQPTYPGFYFRFVLESTVEIKQ